MEDGSLSPGREKEVLQIKKGKKERTDWMELFEPCSRRKKVRANE
jgi:hypothetical protein